MAGAERFAAELPDTRMEVVPGTGHFVFDEAPDVTAAQVAAFLQALE